MQHYARAVALFTGVQRPALWHSSPGSGVLLRGVAFFTGSGVAFFTGVQRRAPRCGIFDRGAALSAIITPCCTGRAASCAADMRHSAPRAELARGLSERNVVPRAQHLAADRRDDVIVVVVPDVSD
jgi:hypothetical protein